MPSHSRKSSRDASQQHHARQPSQPPPTKHRRTSTLPEPPQLLRLPSGASTAPSASSRPRRQTNPSTPTAPFSASSATSPSYFSPQPAATGPDARSPSTRRPPASHSGHGIDNSRGPPVALVTRGNSDIARRPPQKHPDFAFAQQQFLQSGLVSPGEASHRQRKDEPAHSRPANTPAVSRRNSASGPRPAQQPMASSVDESSEYDSAPRSYTKDHRAPRKVQEADTSSTDDEQTEDLFLNIAADTAPKQRPADSTSRIDRLKVSVSSPETSQAPLPSILPTSYDTASLRPQSRMARVNNRQSLPSALHSPSPVPSVGAPTISRIPSNGQRRASQLPTSARKPQERSPLAPAVTTPRTRDHDLTSKTSFSSRKDAELSPRDFLAQFSRRGSQPDPLHTPPSRNSTFRPSNLQYSSLRDDSRTPQIEPVYETASRADGTESHGSTGPAASVWDELDELKTRIRKIELGGKIPATSGAIVSQASADRPRTANTSATTVSSSPNQQRKPNISPTESTVGSLPASGSRVHPLLRDALAKARQNIPLHVYRILESTATEALTLAEMTGSAGPQGTLHSASSILGGSNVSDRQVRRKADNICRSLTELCIAISDNKASLASPALRSSAASISRRPSVQINGDSPNIRQSIEPESNTLSNVSPSRALSRIEARRTSMLNGGQREASQDPLDDRHIPSRLSRAGTSLHRTHGSYDEDDEEDPTLRAPSRAMTDFRSLRPAEKNRFSSSRHYTSREPMPELAPSPALQQTTMNLRRPTVSGVTNENSLLFRDGQRRYDFNRESSPAYEKQIAGNLRARAQIGVSRTPNRNSIGGISDLNRSVSLGTRRMRGSSTGE